MCYVCSTERSGPGIPLKSAVAREPLFSHPPLLGSKHCPDIPAVPAHGKKKKITPLVNVSCESLESSLYCLTNIKAERELRYKVFELWDTGHLDSV